MCWILFFSIVVSTKWQLCYSSSSSVVVDEAQCSHFILGVLFSTTCYTMLLSYFDILYSKSYSSILFWSYGNCLHIFLLCY